MSERIGLGVSRDSVRVVVVRRGKVIWSVATTVERNEELRATIVRALRLLPRTRWQRRRVLVAIGPAAAQVKHLTSLPAVRNERLLGQAVAVNAGRFFLRNGIPLRVTTVRMDGPGSVWVGAIEAPVVSAVEEACRECRLRYDGAVPAVMVLAHALASADGPCTLGWRDDNVFAESEFEKGRLVRTRRVAPDESGGADRLVATPALAQIEGEGAGWGFADAYGVSVSDPRDPLFLRPSTDAAKRRRFAAARRTALVLVVALLGVSALFAPGIIASRAGRRSSVLLSGLAPRQREVATTQATLTQLSRALETAAEFGRDRVRMTRLLAAITEAIPESTALLTLRVDSTGGNAVALATRGAEVLSAIRQVAGVSGAQITAPLTREVVGGAEVERVAIRFHFPRRAKQPVRGRPKGTPR